MGVKFMEMTNAESEEFERTMLEARPEIFAVGCGGAGCNTISRLMEMDVPGIETIAVNTDAQDLLHTNSDRKVLIGRDVTEGLGAGNNPKKGREAAESDIDLLRDQFHEADMAFITCGLGGGTGTGAGPVVAEVAKREEALTVGVLTFPFEVEGKRRERNARAGLEEFREVLDSVVIIPDDKLLEVAPDLSIVEAFKFADTVLADAVRGITELVTRPGLINLDFADIETILKDGGGTMLGFGESDSDNRSQEAAVQALESPLLEVDMSRVSEALVNIVGCPDLSLEEAEVVAGRISKSLSSDANVIWGAQINEGLKKTIRVLIVVPGVEFPWSRGVEELERKRKIAEETLENLEKIS